MSKKLALLILSLGAVASAQAMALYPENHHAHDTKSPAETPAVAPEIDPASAMSAFTLLAGGLVMIRGRRARK
jgi:hypothetical protein